MALEDGGVLGRCLAKLGDKSAASKRAALRVYEECRRSRTDAVVARGNHNQEMYHLHDGPRQEARDRLFRQFEDMDNRWAEGNDVTLPRSLDTGSDPFPWRRHGVGSWLLTYRMEEDVEEKWEKLMCEERSRLV